MLGIDPGGTTGIAVVDFTTPILSVSVAAELDKAATFQYVWHLLNDLDTPITAIAIERFTITARTAKLSQQPDALKIVGAVEGYEAILDRRIEITEQMPADAKTVWSNERLAATGLNVQGGHAKDALRHAMLYIQRRYPSAIR